MRSLVSKIVRAARLDADLYNEVKVNNKENLLAFVVVMSVSLTISIGIGLAGIGFVSRRRAVA